MAGLAIHALCIPSPGIAIGQDTSTTNLTRLCHFSKITTVYAVNFAWKHAWQMEKYGYIISFQKKQASVYFLHFM